MSQNSTESLSIRQALADDAWEGHEDPLTGADLDTITATVAKAAAVIVTAQYDDFAAHETTDRAWVAGWHSATRHVAHALTGNPSPIRDALTEDAWEGHDETLSGADLDAIALVAAKGACSIAQAQSEAFLDSPNLDRNWVSGWRAAVRNAAFVLAAEDLTQQ